MTKQAQQTRPESEYALSVSDLRKMARAHLPEIIGALRKLAQSTDRRVSVEACKLLARATQHLEPAHREAAIHPFKAAER